MNRRQTFLALAATLLPLQKAIGGPFRRRRCVPSKVVRDVPKATPAVAKTGDSFIQPDYDKWGQVKVGMTEAEVLDLMGKPIERETEESVIAEFREGGGMTKAEATQYLRSLIAYRFQWLYGRIKYDSPAFPRTYDFTLYFNQGRLAEKDDPFGGQLSPDGKPTTPFLILPVNGASFNHYPRFLDLRWYPSPGEYPMEYDLDVDLIDGPLHCRLPHAVLSFRGKGPGRWRVKARNRLGESDWSKYRTFEFTV
jgi:hypothetical protein